MSYHVICPDGYVRPENNGCAWDRGYDTEEAADRRAAMQDEDAPASCCGRRSHRVKQGIRIPDGKGET